MALFRRRVQRIGKVAIWASDFDIVVYKLTGIKLFKLYWR